MHVKMQFNKHLINAFLNAFLKCNLKCNLKMDLKNVITITAKVNFYNFLPIKIWIALENESVELLLFFFLSLFLKNSDILYGRYDTKNMDLNLLNKVQEMLNTINGTENINLEVIYIITWKNLILDPTKSQVLQNSDIILINI